VEVIVGIALSAALVGLLCGAALMYTMVLHWDAHLGRERDTELQPLTHRV
jgi:flagellar motor component MotA